MFNWSNTNLCGLHVFQYVPHVSDSFNNINNKQFVNFFSVYSFMHYSRPVNKHSKKTVQLYCVFVVITLIDLRLTFTHLQTSLIWTRYSEPLYVHYCSKVRAQYYLIFFFPKKLILFSKLIKNSKDRYNQVYIKISI